MVRKTATQFMSYKSGRIVTIAVLMAAVSLIIIGICSGQASEVYLKAVNICLECIGVG